MARKKYGTGIDLGGSDISKGGFETFTTLPTTFQGTQITYAGKVYTWNGSAYKCDADYLVVGGRNLVLNSDKIGCVLLYGITGTLTNIPDTSLSSGKKFQITDIVRTIGDYTFFIPTASNPEIFSETLQGKQLTMSFLIRTNNNQILSLDGSINEPISVSSNWVLYKKTFTYNSGNIHFKLTGADLNFIEISGLKFEKGTIPTDWTPAPEDKLDVGGTAVNSEKLDGKDSLDFFERHRTPIDLATANSLTLAPGTYDLRGVQLVPGDNDIHWTLIQYGEYEEPYRTQVAMAYSDPGNNKMYRRTSKGTFWTDWVNVADGGNANTLGGYGVSNYFGSHEDTVWPKLNVARTNLGNPSVLEAGVIDGQFTNKSWFYPIANTLYERSNDDVSYSTATDIDDYWKKQLVCDGAYSNIVIPKGSYLRITFINDGRYNSFDMLYLYYEYTGSTSFIKVEKLVNSSNTWVTLVDYQAFGGWPAHTVVRHTPVWFLNAMDSSAHSEKVRITIKVNPDESGGLNPNHHLYKLNWYGGYPVGSKTLYSWDQNGAVYFPSLVSSNESINFDASEEPAQTGASVVKTSTWLWQSFAKWIKWLRSNSWIKSGSWIPTSLSYQSATRLLGITSPDSSAEFGLAYLNGKMYPYADGKFYQNEGAYEVLDTSDIGVNIVPFSTGGTVDVDDIGLDTKLFAGSIGSWLNKGPSVDNAGALLNILTHPGSYCSQLWFSTSDEEFFLRSIINGTILSWKKIWHEGNFDPGSKADLLHNHAGTYETPANVNSKIETAINNALSSLLTYKGSKATFGDLPVSGNKIGDTWNVQAAYFDFPAGTNFSWDGIAWDGLGGIIGLVTQTVAGLMSASDKIFIDALFALFSFRSLSGVADLLISKRVQINPTSPAGSYNEGLRIANSSAGWSLVSIGADPSENSGANADNNQWFFIKDPNGNVGILRGTRSGATTTVSIDNGLYLEKPTANSQGSIKYLGNLLETYRQYTGSDLHTIADGTWWVNANLAGIPNLYCGDDTGMILGVITSRTHTVGTEGYKQQTFQLFDSVNTEPRMYIRSCLGNNTWTTWKRVLTCSDLVFKRFSLLDAQTQSFELLPTKKKYRIFVDEYSPSELSFTLPHIDDVQDGEEYSAMQEQELELTYTGISLNAVDITFNSPQSQTIYFGEVFHRLYDMEGSGLIVYKMRFIFEQGWFINSEYFAK